MGEPRHADLTTLSHAEIDAEIQRLDEAFVKILGVSVSSSASGRFT